MSEDGKSKVLSSNEDLGKTIDLEIYAGRSTGLKIFDPQAVKLARIKAELLSKEYDLDSTKIAETLIKKLKI